ncbi:MAG: hypothetical protein RLZZ380_80 [Actinomycetota bacterium]
MKVPEVRKFDQTDAWNLGVIAHDLAAARNYPINIDIRQEQTSLFTVRLPGATEVNLDWARRKRNLTLLTKQASWEFDKARRAGHDILVEQNLDETDFASHGGCVPIKVNGELVATLAISGLPSIEDHEFAIECLNLLNAQ